MDRGLREGRGDLRRRATKVGRTNKRWYAAWQGEFAVGTPEHEALSQIDTGSPDGSGGDGGEGGGGGETPTVPGAATLSLATDSGGR